MIPPSSGWNHVAIVAVRANGLILDDIRTLAVIIGDLHA